MLVSALSPLMLRNMKLPGRPRKKLCGNFEPACGKRSNCAALEILRGSTIEFSCDLAGSQESGTRSERQSSGAGCMFPIETGRSARHHRSERGWQELATAAPEQT